MSLTRIGIITALVIMPGTMADAQTSRRTAADKPKAARVEHQEGTVLSFSSTELKVEEDRGAKRKEMTFVLNSDTKTKGELAEGARVRVAFKFENEQNVATEVTVLAVRGKGPRSRTGKPDTK